MDEKQVFQQVREALSKGDRATAQRLLDQLVQANPENWVAWHWLSSLVDDPGRKRRCLEQVLEIDPDNSMAKRELEALEMDIPKAYSKLLNADMFSGSRVGFGGHMPLTVRAFLILLQAPQADELFKSLLEEATLAGQLYALCGLYSVDHKILRDVVERYRYQDDEVETMFGCIVDSHKVSDLIPDILNGRYTADFIR